MNRALWCLVAALATVSNAQVTVEIPPSEGPTVKGLSAPILLGASNCSKEDWRLSVTGGIPGATYEVYASAGNPPQFVDILGTYPVNPNSEGITVIDVWVHSTFPDLTVRQLVGSNIWSPFSKPIPRRNPSQLATPSISAPPLFECGRATVVTGHQPGDQVTLSSHVHGTRFVIPSAFGLNDYMPAGQPTRFSAGENITVQYSTCQGAPQTSPVSLPVTVQLFPGQLPAVVVRSPSLATGVTRFQLEGTVNGALARVALSRGSGTTTWTEACPEDHCVAHLPSALGGLQSGDRIDVTQELCRGSTSLATSEEVKGCGDTPRAELVSPPQPGDSQIRLVSYPLGAMVRVYATKSNNPQVDLEMIGYAYDTPVVELTRPIDTSDRWVLIAIDTSGCLAQTATGYSVAW